MEGNLTTAIDRHIPVVDPWVEYLKFIYLILLKYVYYVPAIIGIPGNILSAIITLQKDNRRVSTSVYMTSLAIADSLTLVSVNYLAVMLSWTAPGDFKYREDLLLIFWYLAYAFGMVSGIFLMEMSMDRLLAIRFPMVAKSLCTASRARWAVGISFIVVFGLNINVFFLYAHSIDPESGVESVKADYPSNRSLEAMASIFQLLGGTLIPFVIILFANIWIIITVRLAAIQRKQLVTSDGVNKRQEETNQLTKILILVSAAYVVCSFPYRAFEIAMSLPVVLETYDFTDPYWLVRYRCEYIGLVILWDFNYAVNFFLYCIAGKKFRRDAKNLFLCLCCQ